VSCGLQDVLELESLGTPAVLVASDAFAQAAARQAELLGAPDLRYRLVAHPIQDRTDDELRALARDVARALIDAVMT
jgi:alkanesulfonate monooxygenase SsuD/methylene tetrahydromethanopterin reductase-like flavin-dependent oxidoreductase (luciferase family)